MQFLSQDPVSWEIGLTNDGKRTLLDPQLQNSYSYSRNNPILYKDPEGRIIFVSVLVAAYVAAEAALSAYDVYNTYQTITSQSTSRWEKAAVAGGFVLGTVAPGAGYGSAGKAVVNKSNYRPIYETAYGKLPSSDIHLHHTIPQMYREQYARAGINIDAPGMLRPIHKNYHINVTREWQLWQKANPNPTNSQINNFANQIDKKYKDQYYKSNN